MLKVYLAEALLNITKYKELTRHLKAISVKYLGTLGIQSGYCG